LLYTYFIYSSLKEEHDELKKAILEGKESLYQERIQRYNCKVDMYNAILWRLSIIKLDRLFKPMPYIMPQDGNQITVKKI